MIAAVLCRQASARQCGRLTRSGYRAVTDLSPFRKLVYRSSNGARSISSMLENTRNIGIIAHVDAVRLTALCTQAILASTLTHHIGQNNDN